MVFIEKLDLLLKMKNINKHELSKESGIPYTTIDGFYKKGAENIKLSTLKKICNYFNVTLDFFDDNNTNNEINKLEPTETKIITEYNKQPELQKAIKKLLDIDE